MLLIKAIKIETKNKIKIVLNVENLLTKFYSEYGLNGLKKS
jgi:hypothetical protein